MGNLEFKIKMPTKSGKASKKPVKKGTAAPVVRRKKRTETFSVYIFRVLKQVHEKTGISKRSMSIMNSFINDVFEKICGDPANSSDTTRDTLSHPEKSRPLSDSSCQESSPSTPSLKEPRLSPNSHLSECQIYRELLLLEI